MEPLFGLYVILEPIRFAGKQVNKKGNAEAPNFHGTRKVVFEYLPTLPEGLEEDIFEYTIKTH